MKVALLRATTTGERGAWMVAGAFVGVLVAAATIVLSVWPMSDSTLVADLLAVVYLTWGTGWVLGPLRGSAPLLRAEHFAMLPIPGRRLAAGLLAAAFVGVGAAVTLLALLSLVTYAARLGLASVLVAVPVVVLQLAVLVAGSQVAAAMFSRVALARTGAALNGALLAIVMVLAQSGWILVVGLVVSDILVEGFPAHWATTLRAVPTGWGLVVVEAVDGGSWLLALAAFAGMVVLVAVLIAVWARTLERPRGSRPVVRGSARPRGRERAVTTQVGAVLRKELYSWWRDPARTSAVVASVTWGVATAALPLTFGEKASLPWAAPLIAVMAATYMANLYGLDGTGIWLTIQTCSERADLRARQWAYIAVFAPITVLVAVGFTMWSGLGWAWPWVIGLLAATLGGGAGLVAWFSVYMPSPGLDPHQRADNPLESADDSVGAAFVMFFAALVPPLPAAAVLTLGTVLEDPVLVWAGAAVGIATGVLVAWALGHIAARRLVATAPDVLFLMRTGRTVVATTVDDPDAAVPNPLVQTLAWTLGSLALFPQGLVPIVLKLSGNDDTKVWFLAMYLPGALGWITAFAMAAVGLTLYVVAIADLRHPPAAAARR
jgi:ABC-2 type transport system permease protein